jgi:hypothetical protein
MGARGVSRQLAELRDLYVADVDQAVRGRWSPVTFEHSLQAMPTDPARQLLLPWELHQRWPASRFVLIDDEGHGGPRMLQELIDAIEAFTATAVTTHG